MNKLRKGDIVQVMIGKDAGKRGEVLSFSTKVNRAGITTYKVLVKGINMVKRAQKANPQMGIPGGIVESEKAIDISNVMFVDLKLDKPTRLGAKIDPESGKKFRYSKKSGELIK